ncbi:MAG: bifunctional phosphopantothenoylcysteine decarboxylase/phosphopantothenate--cysteine ligase CoaBC [Candidatus Aenigmarchaeota archaeon]|nr:bifunctional phosphopantothenoylcysteine decarboxylase/phosphopantothenate--cysteine ligase CoaBC [Candidatus Aenigmarchaeota archaeon]
MILKNKTIVLGISSSIATYKSLDLIKQFKKKGADVIVIMTDNATKLVNPDEFEQASGNKVFLKQFAPNVDFRDYLKKDAKINHISLADRADLFLICPCTANTISKLACGIADNLLCTSVMATNAPVILCPAMNVKMWYNPTIQENIRKLTINGYEIVEPEEGILACGYKGMGRLAGFEKIIEQTTLTLTRSNDLKNKKILVTAGATVEDIDAVRVITNKSSGKTGAYIAREAAKRGAKVTLVRGYNSVEPMYFGIKDIIIKDTDDLFNKIKENIQDTDIMIHTAAVSDYTLTNKKEEKIKSTNKQLSLELKPTVKILDKIKEIKKDIFLVGFKAECNIDTDVLIERSYKRLKEANADIMVANDIGKKNCGFDVETNEVLIIDKNKKIKHVKLTLKRNIAKELLDYICKS